MTLVSFGISERHEHRPFRWLDSLVQERLQQWPNRPPGLKRDTQTGYWLRGRPGPVANNYQPFLKLPGSDRLRTLPDGLWLNFGGTPAEPYADIFAIEACGNIQNLLDKRSRFAPSTHSLVAVCPVPWLLGPVAENDPTPRWRAIGVVAAEPIAPLILPVRDLRVMYGLKKTHYEGFTRSQLPHAHEYFVPMEALTAAASHEDPAMQALVERAASSAYGNFFAGTAPDQPSNGSRTRIVSSRSGLVESSVTGASVNSSMRRTYLMAAAGSSAQDRAPLVDSLQPSIDS